MFRVRVTWPQPSYAAVVSRSVASTIPVTLAPKDARLSHGSPGAMEPGLQVPQVQLHQMRGSRLRAHGPLGARALPLGRPTLADTVARVLGIEAHHAHQRVSAAPHGRQGMHA